MSNTFHKTLVGDDIHALNAETYADIAARDADTAFQITENINKMVRVDSPASYYILTSLSPTVWSETSSTDTPEFVSVTITNVGAGADPVLSSNDPEQALTLTGFLKVDGNTNVGDSAFVNDQLTVGSLSDADPDASIDLQATDKALLLNRLTTTQRDGLTAVSGMHIYNATLNDVEYFNGVSWVSMSGGDITGPPSSVIGSVPSFSTTGGKNIQDPNTLFIVSGNAGIGISVPDGTLHVHTASAGVIGPTSSANDLTVENSADAGITILTPDANISALNFGSPNRQTGAFLRWQNSTQLFSIGTGDTDGEMSFETGLSIEAMRISSLGALRLNASFSRQRVVTAVSNNTASMGFASIYAVTDTSAPRTITISTSDIVLATYGDGREFIIKDESGGAGTNNITIVTEGSETIDGVTSVDISVDYGVIKLYSDGNNLFSFAQKSSRAIGSFVVGSNATVTVIDTQNTFVNLNLGSPGAVAAGINKQFTITNATTGEMRYDGLNPISMNVSGMIAASSTGGGNRFNFQLLKNGSVLPSPDDVNIPIEVGSSLSATSTVWSVSLVQNDLLRIQVENADGASDITIDTLKLNVR